jgi:hypothetical protein
MTIAEQVGRLMGESLVRGTEREWKRKVQVLEAYMALIDLELKVFLLTRNGGDDEHG